MRSPLLANTLPWFLVIAAGLAAQQPAPAAETEPEVWSAEEGGVLHLLRASLQRIRDAEPPLRFGGRTMRNGGYEFGFFVQGGAGDPELADAVARDQDVFGLAWPLAVGPETRRAVLMHADGTALFCEPAGEDLPGLEAELALAKGSKGRFRDVLRQPGTGSGGHLWLWLHQTSTRQNVQVVDVRGNPRPGLVVVVVGNLEGQRDDATIVPLPKPLPLAQGTTDARGVAELAGPRCRATVAMLRTGDASVVGSRVRVENVPEGLRFVVPDEAIVNPRMFANESAAIATLKNICSAQAQCQASAVIDTNGNGAGEYGFFGELSGAVAVRSDGKGGVGERKITPPVLSRAFANVTAARVQRSGYVFQIFLPDQNALPAAEAATGGSAGVAVDSRLAEVVWCCYAWPASPTSGLRAFFVNQASDVLACDNADGRYQGNEQPPAPTAAFAAGTTGKMDSKIAANGPGLDGQRWIVVN
jgi:hypothetical protein